MDMYTICFSMPSQVGNHDPNPTGHWDQNGSRIDDHLKPPIAEVTGTSQVSASHQSLAPIALSAVPGEHANAAHEAILAAQSSSKHQPRTSLSSSSEASSENGISGRPSTAASSVLTDIATPTSGTTSQLLRGGSSRETETQPGCFPASDASASEARNMQPYTDMTHTMHKLCSEISADSRAFVSYSIVGGDNSQASSSLNSHRPHTSFVGPASTQTSVLQITGEYRSSMFARGALLRANPSKQKLVVKVPRGEILDHEDQIKVQMRRKLDEIALLTKAHIAIVGQTASNIGYGLEIERNVEFVITGSSESVEQARVRLLVLLDELNGLHSEVCEIDFKLHNIISGRRRSVLQAIQGETATNIYLPSPLSAALGHVHASFIAKYNLIFITGEFFGVQRAREMLFQVSLQKSKCIISRDATLLPRKLDWMLLERFDDLLQITSDNATFVNFPPIGSQSSTVTVFGEFRASIERTIRSLMSLACQFYIGSFWLLPAAYDAFRPPPTIDTAHIALALKQITLSSDVEAVFKSNCFEFHGPDDRVRAAIQMVSDLDFVQQFHHEVRFQIELGNEHREFISGKKNGKLNKIMKSAEVHIKFETLNDYNFVISISGKNPGVLHGLAMLQEELPAEISFYVPESSNHKRIIGIGGKSIQRIMKKYGVYVKFSNADEHARIGGYRNNEDNVVARTPAKNAVSLEHLKQAIMELIPIGERNFVNETIVVPRRYHRILLGEKNIFIQDIKAKTNSIITFPSKESASDTITIFGPEVHVHAAAQMLRDLVPFEAEYRVPHSREYSALKSTSEFAELIQRIKQDLDILVTPSGDLGAREAEPVIRFSLKRSNVDLLPVARDRVEAFLTQHNIELYPGSQRPRSGLAFDASPYVNSFDSRLNLPQSSGSRDIHDRRFPITATSFPINLLLDNKVGEDNLESQSRTQYRPAIRRNLAPQSLSRPAREAADVAGLFPTGRAQDTIAYVNPNESAATSYYHRGWGTMPNASSPSLFSSNSVNAEALGSSTSPSFLSSRADAPLSRSNTMARHQPSPSDAGPKILHGISASISSTNDFTFAPSRDKSKSPLPSSGRSHHRPRGMAQSFDLSHMPAHRRRLNATHQPHDSVDEVDSAFFALDF